jgi:excisionase family DNA binding protein
MAYRFPPRSTHETSQSRFEAIDFEPLLDPVEAAALLRIHPGTLKKLARKGEIHGSHVGKCWRFRASDLNDWLLRQERAG